MGVYSSSCKKNAQKIEDEYGNRRWSDYNPEWYELNIDFQLFVQFYLIPFVYLTLKSLDLLLEWFSVPQTVILFRILYAEHSTPPVNLVMIFSDTNTFPTPFEFLMDIEKFDCSQYDYKEYPKIVRCVQMDDFIGSSHTAIARNNFAAFVEPSPDDVSGQKPLSDELFGLEPLIDELSVLEPLPDDVSDAKNWNSRSWLF